MERIRGPLVSKKFWATIVGAVVSAAAPHFGVPPEISQRVVDLVMIYLGVEGGVDGIRAWAEARKSGGA